MADHGEDIRLRPLVRLVRGAKWPQAMAAARAAEHAAIVQCRIVAVTRQCCGNLPGEITSCRPSKLDGQLTRWRRSATLTAAVRLVTSSLASTLLTWKFTVERDNTSC